MECYTIYLHKFIITINIIITIINLYIYIYHPCVHARMFKTQGKAEGINRYPHVSNHHR